MILSCSDFDLVNTGMIICCSSCHEDHNCDYKFNDLVDFTPPGKSSVKAFVCCSLYDFVEDLTREQWATVVKIARNK